MLGLIVAQDSSWWNNCKFAFLANTVQLLERSLSRLAHDWNKDPRYSTASWLGTPWNILEGGDITCRVMLNKGIQ
jgi:hypothetical protein